MIGIGDICVRICGIGVTDYEVRGVWYSVGDVDA